MPEAPVDEDSQASPYKDEIGTDGSASGPADGPVDEEPAAAPVQLGSQCALRPCVAPPVGAHLVGRDKV
jgi:hypothetical protein